MSADFNILVDENVEIIKAITGLVMNSYLAGRAAQMPALDPEQHYEHQEAKVMTAIYDGPLPTDEEFARFRHAPKDQRPKFYNEMTEIVVGILDAFTKATGKSPATAHLELRDRAILWRGAVGAVAGLLREPRPKAARRRSR